MIYIFIKKLVKRKTKAFKIGDGHFSEMKKRWNLYIANLSVNNSFIGLSQIETTKFIYNDPSFYEYLKYTFIGKYYERLINLIILFISLLFIGVGIALYLVLGMCLLFGILCVILIIGLYIILKLIKTGEKYEDYYKRTFYKFILDTFNNITFDIDNKRNLTVDEIDNIMNILYDNKTTSKNIDFKGSLSRGNICDLKLVKVTKRTDSAGKTRRSTHTVFDGFYTNINLDKNYNKLKGNMIKIKADETIFSSITEDTIKGIYESDLEFNFNSEEMNKSFDCKISGYAGFDDVDDMMREVHKIITPSFEKHLLYLRERYNSFNMNITDTSLTLSTNMDRSLFQKAKHGELLEFRDTYREANEKFRLLKPNTLGIKDFVYYNVFPFIERLYTLNYLNYLYLSYMDFENYYDINNNFINSYEEQMKVIYEMKNKDFKEYYTDKIEQIYKDTKNNLKLVKMED